MSHGSVKDLAIQRYDAGLRHRVPRSTELGRTRQSAYLHSDFRIAACRTNGAHARLTATCRQLDMVLSRGDRHTETTLCAELSVGLSVHEQFQPNGTALKAGPNKS
jgi:hypothetical protein